jgi:hypothetical protein
MEKLKLNKIQISRLLRTIITTALYPYYLQKHNGDIDKAIKNTDLTVCYLSDRIKDDVDAYTDLNYDEIE